ncbi:TPA: hypothetical protein HA338_01185 [Methanosarcina acetivorans]|uniref:Uncharacterized protein n=1 Tax=Methanosarcina acetivorans TaxID=2214 RepID=A0A832SFZ0_9EURY|nr:hypothetical protein [Methanosarcina acetivorans]HIH92695.1 hypothetical protein [Methanosarcina acetivorans]
MVVSIHIKGYDETLFTSVLQSISTPGYREVVKVMGDGKNRKNGSQAE